MDNYDRYSQDLIDLRMQEEGFALDVKVGSLWSICNGETGVVIGFSEEDKTALLMVEYRYLYQYCSVTGALISKGELVHLESKDEEYPLYPYVGQEWPMYDTHMYESIYKFKVYPDDPHGGMVDKSNTLFCLLCEDYYQKSDIVSYKQFSTRGSVCH